MRNMLKVYCYNLSYKTIEEFYGDKIPNGFLPPSNQYIVYVVKMKNSEDKLFEYSELVLIKIKPSRLYPVVMLNINISSKYSAFFCDATSEVDYIDKYDLIDGKINANHMERISVVLDNLL